MGVAADCDRGVGWGVVVGRREWVPRILHLFLDDVLKMLGLISCMLKHK